MSGRGRGKRLRARGGGDSGMSLNERFSRSATNPGRRVRRNLASQRGTAARFANVMTKRTGQRRTPAPVRRGGLAGRGRGGRGGRGGIRGTRGRIRRTFAGRGRGRGRGGRGRGRGRGGRPPSKEDLDNDLEAYMGRSEKAVTAQLDEELESYMMDRSETNQKEEQ